VRLGEGREPGKIGKQEGMWLGQGAPTVSARCEPTACRSERAVYTCCAARMTRASIATAMPSPSVAPNP
jgi:hypothetical protein